MINRKGTENQVADHLSRLEDEAMRELGDKTEIDDTFSHDHVLATSQDLIPCFAYFVNYLASDIIPPDCRFIKGKSSLYDVKSSFGIRHTCIGVVPMGLFGVVCYKLRC